MTAAAAEQLPYVGTWSNGRGETLVVTEKMMQFANDPPVTYRDFTRGGDNHRFELRITAPRVVNPFPGKSLRVTCEETSMEMVGYRSHADLMQERNRQQVVTWERENTPTAPGEGPRSGKKTGYTPQPGSGERKAIAFALHAPCERDLKQDVLLEFEQLRIVGDWALARVRPLQPNEEPIDYRRTKYREQQEEGMFDPSGEALLQRKGRRWKILEWRFGHTDTEMAEWIKKHGAPKALIQ
jgi:hypothetical protein